jgi:hypothetical protein
MVGFFITLLSILTDNNSSIEDELKCNNDRPSISSSKIEKNRLNDQIIVIRRYL